MLMARKMPPIISPTLIQSNEVMAKIPPLINRYAAKKIIMLGGKSAKNALPIKINPAIISARPKTLSITITMTATTLR